MIITKPNQLPAALANRNHDPDALLAYGWRYPLVHPTRRAYEFYMHTGGEVGYCPECAQQNQHLNLFGICLGGKKCKKRKQARQEAKVIRRESKTERVLARTEQIKSGERKGFLATVGGVFGNIFGRRDESGSEAPMDPQVLAALLAAGQRPPPPKPKMAGASKIGIALLVLVLVGWIASVLLKKKK